MRSAAPDPGVLNRAEWIKYVSAFFNKEDVANRVFEATATVSGTAHSTTAQHIPLRLGPGLELGARGTGQLKGSQLSSHAANAEP